jgi:predicted HicB family RNase H-like nuclease
MQYYVMISMSQTKKEQREATSIKIRPTVWKEAKIEAIKQGITVSELVEKAIETWINEKIGAKKVERRPKAT